MAAMRRAAPAALFHARTVPRPHIRFVGTADEGSRILDHSHERPEPIPTGLRGRCPRCGQGHLFKGFLTLRPSCEACGLDYANFDSADGPAFFVMSIVGLVVVGLALWMEFTYEPPIWVHALVAGSLSIGLSLLLVRPLKGMLIALQYANKAEQGRFEP